LQTQFIVNSSGNVGIGTTTPERRLDVIQAADEYQGGFSVANAAKSGRLNLWVDSLNRSRIDSGDSAEGIIALNAAGNGNVGIGTSAPAYKLHISGTAGFSSTIYAPNIGTGTDNSVVVLDDANGNLVTAEIDSRVWGATLLNGSSLTQNYLTKVDATTNQLINSAVFEIGGNVGIGTTAPSSMLEVGGNIELNQYLYFANSTSEYLRWDTADFILSDDLLPSAADTLSLGATTAEWNSLFIGDGSGLTAGGGLFFGNDQDFLFSFDSSNSLFKLSDGTNSFLSVKDNGSLANFAFNGDDFEITEASLSANIPASFNAAGDTEVAYNLNFSSDTANYIRSLSPLYIEAGDANSAEDLVLRSRGSGDVVIGNSATTVFKNDGNIGVNTTAPTVALDVNGNARFRSIGSGTYTGAVNRTSDGTLTTATSDIAFKKDVTTITNALDIVKQLRGVTFNWKDNSNTNKMVGMIAQEVQAVMPELVFQNSTDGYLGMYYGETTALLIEAMKEQQIQIEGLKLTEAGEAILSFNSSTQNYEVKKGESLISQTVALAEGLIAKVRAGMINTQELVVETLAQFKGNVEIEGTLTAQAISSPTLTTITTNLQNLTTQVNNLQTEMNNVITQDVQTGEYFMNVAALSTLNLTVSDSANIASVNIEDSTISTNLAELKFEALERVSFFESKVVIAQDGSITAQGEIIAKKGIKVINDAEQTVASIDASGSAYFAQGVTFDKNIASESAVIAKEQTFAEIGENTSSVVTNGEASGQAVLPAGQQEMLIRNSKVKDNSLIYVSPEGSTNGQVLYLDEKKEGEWFKVKLDATSSAGIKFNWWIL